MRAFRYEALPGRVVFGSGSSRRELASEVDSVGSRVLLITTKRAEPLAAQLTEPLRARLVGVFTDVHEHVPQEIAEAARTAAHEARANCLLSIGGGSVVGTAKAVAVEARLPIVAVPTTYAGSERTPTWGLTAAGRKRVGRSTDVVPRCAVYDPTLTLTLPAGTTAASGMNALAHCVGALASPDLDPITHLVAEEGIRALAGGLPVAVRQPDDLDGRAEAMYGAYLAASALASAGAGLPHRICHVLGGAYGLSHARTHAVVLPYAATLFEDRLSRVAGALGTPRAADGLRELAERIGAPTSLAEIGLRDPEDAARLVAEAGVLDDSEARRVVESAYEGRWPA